MEGGGLMVDDIILICPGLLGWVERSNDTIRLLERSEARFDGSEDTWLQSCGGKSEKL